MSYRVGGAINVSFIFLEYALIYRIILDNLMLDAHTQKKKTQKKTNNKTRTRVTKNYSIEDISIEMRCKVCIHQHDRPKLKG